MIYDIHPMYLFDFPHFSLCVNKFDFYFISLLVYFFIISFAQLTFILAVSWLCLLIFVHMCALQFTASGKCISCVHYLLVYFSASRWLSAYFIQLCCLSRHWSFSSVPWSGTCWLVMPTCNWIISHVTIWFAIISWINKNVCAWLSRLAIIIKGNHSW